MHKTAHTHTHTHTVVYAVMPTNKLSKLCIWNETCTHAYKLKHKHTTETIEIYREKYSGMEKSCLKLEAALCKVS